MHMDVMLCGLGSVSVDFLALHLVSGKSGIDPPLL